LAGNEPVPLNEVFISITSQSNKVSLTACLASSSLTKLGPWTKKTREHSRRFTSLQRISAKCGELRQHHSENKLQCQQVKV